MLNYLVLYVVINLACMPVRSRLIPRYEDLDEEDRQLFRAAYDTPSYDHDSYQEDDLQPGRLDLVKDGMWVIKAKIKELKAFDKALAANMLATNMKVKDLIENHLGPIKNHHHHDIDKKKPIYYEPPHPQYDQQYVPPPPQEYRHGHDPYRGH